MDAFKLHQQVIENYRHYLQSFTNIRDPRIKEYMDEAFEAEKFIPESLIQFNPAYNCSKTLEDLVKKL